MATIYPQITYPEKGVVKILWETVGGADTGAAECTARYSDKTVQVTGTWGTSTVLTIQGSNDGTNFVTLEDVDPTFVWGTGGVTGALSVTALPAALAVVKENPMYIRVITASGTGADLDVTIIGRSDS